MTSSSSIKLTWKLLCFLFSGFEPESFPISTIEEILLLWAVLNSVKFYKIQNINHFISLYSSILFKIKQKIVSRKNIQAWRFWLFFFKIKGISVLYHKAFLKRNKIIYHYWIQYLHLVLSLFLAILGGRLLGPLFVSRCHQRSAQ